MSLLEIVPLQIFTPAFAKENQLNQKIHEIASMLNFNKFQGLKAEASPSEEAHKFCEWPIFPLVDIGTNHYSPNEINEIRVCSVFTRKV